jgi:hypothetical protein
MNTEANQFFADSPANIALEGCQQRIDLPARQHLQQLTLIQPDQHPLALT